MKKSLIALAVMAAAGAASAQSSVTLFGVVDATYAYGKTSGGTKVNQLTNSGYNSSRLGFRGTEDLGGGMSASFWLEAGISNDDGRAGGGIASGNQATNVAGNTGLNFNRRSTVSLSSGWGELRLGRDYVPSFWNLTVFDPFGTNGVGTTQSLNGSPGGSTLVRASNTIGYFLPPNLGGFYGQVQFGFGENSSPAVAGVGPADGSTAGFRFGFARGPFNVALGYTTTGAPTTFAAPTSGDYTSWNIGGSYDLGMAKLMAHYTADEREGARFAGPPVVDNSVDGKGWLIGALVPVGPGEIRAAYSQYVRDLVGAPDPKQRKFAIGYVHNLSKRTALYTTFATLKNSNGAAAGLNGSSAVANRTANGFDLGVRHSF